MTRGSIQEYTGAVRERYLRVNKKGKGKILDEFVNVTGYHRKSAIRLLHRKRQVVPSYYVTRHYVNFFQPVMKLVAKSRHGAKVRKVYDTARTPYQRLLDSGVLSEAKQHELAATYSGLNPVLLLEQINGHLERLWRLAERPAHQHRNTKTRETSVTTIYDAMTAVR